MIIRDLVNAFKIDHTKDKEAITAHVYLKYQKGKGRFMFIKINSTGVRLAYVAVPSQFREPISKALYNLNITVSPLLAELTARTIVSNQFEVLVESHREQTFRRNQVVDRYLADYTCLGVETGIFRWLLLSGKITGAEFETLAAQQGVQVYAAERFVVGNSCPERAVRVSVCAPETLEELERGLIILIRLLNEFT